MTKPTEMKSTLADVSPVHSADAELDPQALSAIRTLMKTEADTPAEPVRPMEPRQMRSEPAMPDMQPVERSAARFEEVRPQSDVSNRRGGMISQMKSRATGYRPTRKHLIIGAAAVLLLLRPWLVVGLVFLLVMTIVCVFLIVGYDGFWQRVVGLGRWYAARNPEKADRLNQKLDRFAMKWDSFLDRFPEGTVDGLYLPDLADLAKAEVRHDEALDRRFAGMREGEA